MEQEATTNSETGVERGEPYPWFKAGSEHKVDKCAEGQDRAVLPNSETGDQEVGSEPPNPALIS